MSRQAVDLEPIDRLEEKVRLLVGMIDRLRAEQARTLEENQRQAREMDALRARISDAQGASAEVEALREERELIRSRVVEMLQRIEALNL
jgi:regulator of replication initiation timing